MITFVSADSYFWYICLKELHPPFYVKARQ